MEQNFAILGMFDKDSVMGVINRQPETYKFIIAAVNAAGGEGRKEAFFPASTRDMSRERKY